MSLGQVGPGLPELFTHGKVSEQNLISGKGEPMKANLLPLPFFEIGYSAERSNLQLF